MSENSSDVGPKLGCKSNVQKLGCPVIFCEDDTIAEQGVKQSCEGFIQRCQKHYILHFDIIPVN